MTRAAGRLLALAAATAWLLGAPLPALAQNYGRVAGPYLPYIGTELKLGLYRPRISSNSQVRTVRDAIYNDRAYFKHPLLYQLQIGVYPARTYGLLGAYGRAGFASESAPSRLCRDAAGAIVRCTAATVGASSRGSDRANMTFLPLSAGVVYRYDMLRRLSAVPLLFAASAGVDYNLWWASVGHSRAEVGGNRAQPARGGVVGLSASVSAQLALSGLSRRARPYGLDAGRQDSYLFVEYSLRHGRDLFRGRRTIDLSDYHSASVGIAIDFR